MVLFTLGMTTSAEAGIFVTDNTWKTKDEVSGFTYIKVCIVAGSDAYRQPPRDIIVHSYPSLETVVGKVRDSLRTSWEHSASIRFIGWENCADLTSASRAEYVGLYIHSDIENHSFIGIKAKGTTAPPTMVKGKLEGPGGPQFAPFGNIDPCIEYDSLTPGYRYKFDCAREYGIHEFGHAIGLEHEWLHPRAPSTCVADITTMPTTDPTVFTRTSIDEGVTYHYFIPNAAFDFDSVMTYNEGCARRLGTRFGSPAPDDFDRQAVAHEYPPVPPTVNAFDVGVIPATNGACPAERKVTIYLDNEDLATSTGGNKRVGWIGPIRSDRNTRLEFCRVDGQKFGRYQPLTVGARTQITTDYAVLKLGISCPAGSQEIVREFDDENDLYNENWMAGGDLGTNQQFSDTESRTLLHFCWFRQDRSDGPAMLAFPQLGFDYGVIGTVYNSLNSGWIYTDDENTDNHNSFKDGSGYFLSDNDIGALSLLISGDINTTINLSLVKHESAPIALDQTVVADGTAQGNLLSGASDPDGDAVTLAITPPDPKVLGNYLSPAHGTFQVSEAGRFLYTPHAGFSGTDSFTFQVTDGYKRSNLATFSIQVPPPPVLTIALDAQPAQSLNFTSSNGETFTLANGAIRDLIFKADQDAVVTAPAPAGWYLNILCPDNVRPAVDIVAGQVKIGVHAAQHITCTYQLRQYGSFNAVVYRDLNANGQYDNAKDKPQAGWTVQLFNEFGNQLDEKATDAQGKANFTSLQQRQYKVCEVLKPGWRNSDPGTAAGQSCKSVNIGGGKQAPIRFGNVKL